jgi:hypothetical protein
MERSAIRDCLTASTLPRISLRFIGATRFPRSVVIEMHVRVLATHCARGLLKFLIPQNRGSRECRVLAAPAVSCAMCTRKCAHEHTGTAGARRHSLRNGLTAYAELSLETNSFCLHRCRLDGGPIRLDPIRHRQLDISHGCQNHSVLPYAATPVILRAVPAHGKTRPANTLRA